MPGDALGTEAAHALELLRGRGDELLTIAELHADGVRAPAQALYELELAGYRLDRIRTHGAAGVGALGYRLNDPSGGDPARAAPAGGSRTSS